MKLDKQFSLSSWAINNRSTVYVIIAIFLIGGFKAYTSMPKENFPETNVATVYVSTVNPGNSVEDIEKFITEPLEDEISNISGVDKIKSTSLQDFSTIEVVFEDDVDPEIAKRRVKDKIDVVKAKSDWPTMDGGAKVSPEALDLNLSEMIPIMNINLSGNYPSQKLKKYGEILQDEIELLSEIKEVKIRGVENMEVEVAVDIYKMMAASVTIDKIVTAIQRENVTISGGNIIANGQRRNIRVIGEIEQPKDLENIIVKNEGGVVYLRDIAEVNFKPKDKTTYAREYGDPVVMLDVKKVYTRDQIDDMVNNIIFGILLVVGVLMFFLGAKNALFVGVAIPLSMLSSLLLLSLFGITLNSMVLFGLVMGLGMLVDNGIVVVENVYRLIGEGMSPKNAAKQGVGEIAWPIIASTATTLAAFAPLGFWPGMIGKFMMYLPITLSVVLGSSLFVALVINSMLTSQFMDAKDEDIPKKKLFLYTGGLIGVGILFVTIGLSTKRYTLSGFGNLFIIVGIAMLLQRYVFSRVVNYFQKRFLPRLENVYERFLTFALTGKKPFLFFFGTIAFLFLSFVLLGIVRPKVLFFPVNEPNEANVYVEYPEGTDIEKTNKLTKEIEQKVIDLMKPYEEKLADGSTYNYMAESIISQVGQGAGNPQVDGGSMAEMPHKGKVSVLFRQYKYRRGVKTSEILEEIRGLVKGYPGVNIIVEKNQNGPPVGYPISLEISGEDYKELMKTALNVKDFINEASIPGIEELNLNVTQNKMERQIIVDRQKAGELGLSTAQVGKALRQAIYGFDASTFKENDEEYDIMVRFNAEDRYNMSALMHQELLFRNNKGVLYKVPIASVATVKDVATFSSIKRKNLKRVITVYSNVLEGYNANEIVQKIDGVLRDYNFPEGVSYSFAGEQEEMAKNMDFLSKALLIALALIALIIVAQFNSVSKPILILITVIFSFIGVFLGMIIFGDDFVILMTMMGIIALAGIVVNNAIVLIDYTQLLIDRRKRELGVDEGMLLTKEEYYNAIVAGGKSRLRPVLLTAITTVLGLIPLAIGLNVDFVSFLQTYNPNIYLGGDNTFFWSPLAWTIVYGLIFATFLTLIIVPVMFYLLNRAKIRLRGGKGIVEV